MLPSRTLQPHSIWRLSLRSSPIAQSKPWPDFKSFAASLNYFRPLRSIHTTHEAVSHGIGSRFISTSPISHMISSTSIRDPNTTQFLVSELASGKLLGKAQTRIDNVREQYKQHMNPEKDAESMDELYTLLVRSSALAIQPEANKKSLTDRNTIDAIRVAAKEAGTLANDAKQLGEEVRA